MIIVLLCGSIIISPMLHAQWVRQKAEVVENLVDVVMLDSVKAIAVGNRNGILRTTDAGTTWVNQTIMVSAIYAWNGLSFFDSMYGAVIGDHRLQTTTDGGLRWQVRTLPSSTQRFLSILQTGPAAISVGTDSGWIYQSSDSGKSWSAENVSTWPIRTLFAWRGDPRVGVSMYALTPHSFCTQYVIPPPSWSEKVLSFFQPLGSEASHAEFCQGGTTGFIVGVFGDLWAQPAIVRKSTSDTAWTVLPSGIMDTGPLTGVSAPSARTIYVGGTNGRIYKTRDTGNTWTKNAVPTARNIRALFFYNETHGFAVGDSGTILYTAYGGEIPVSVREHGSVPSRFNLYQNYPNPFNPVTVIGYELPVTSYVRLSVVDLLGREIALLVEGVQPAGRFSTQWDAQRVSSGIYFYRLKASRTTGAQTDNIAISKKLILLR